MIESSICGSKIIKLYERQVIKKGIVTYQKEGKLVYYSLDDELVKLLVEKPFVHQREIMKVGNTAKTLTEDKKAYRVKGFPRANFAGKFEKRETNMKRAEQDNIALFFTLSSCEKQYLGNNGKHW